MAMQRLNTEQLYQVADLDKLPCKSTKELAPIDEIVGQERAQKPLSSRCQSRKRVTTFMR